ncbi:MULTISPECIES: hypothetical protein [Bacillus]|nr:hypothetical protein [Bacillus mycoides]SCM85647.1 Protein of unknown function [Bacillus mycoides]
MSINNYKLLEELLIFSGKFRIELSIHHLQKLASQSKRLISVVTSEL